MGTLWTDVRYSLRLLGRSPGFAGISILTLALGIGANTAIFSLIDAVLIRPLPYADADRLVAVWEDASAVSFPKNTPAPANYVDWTRRNRSFAGMAALRSHTANLSGDGTPELVFGRAVTASFFPVLGVAPLAGRTFTEADDRPEARVVVLSYGLWQRRYGGDTALVGRSITVNGLAYTVIGVMPRGFSFPIAETEYWVPAGFTEKQLANRGGHYLRVVARLRPEVTLGQARQDMQRIAAELAKEYPDTNARLGAVVVPLREELAGDSRLALWVLLAAAASILLIGCANIANLLLARATGRSREIAVRIALGAGRGRLIAQLLTESLVLAAVGGAAGVLLAVATLRVMAKLVPLNMTNHVTLAVDGRLLLFTAGIAVATAVLFGLVPAWQAASRSLEETLRRAGRGGIGGTHGGLRGALVVAEVALSVMLVAGSGLLVRTLIHLRQLDPGFEPANLLTMTMVLPSSRYPQATGFNRFYDSVLERVQALPGVRSAAFCQNVPTSQAGNTTGYQVRGKPREPGQDALYRPGTAAYLQTLGARLKYGRLFDGRDTPGSQRAAVINETMARRHWPEGQAVGEEIRFDFSNATEQSWMTVIGVVHEIRERGLDIDPKPAIYFPNAQRPDGQLNFLAIRTAADPMRLVPAVRDAVRQVDAGQPIFGIRTGEEWLDRQVANRRERLAMLGSFAALALLLAAIGIYGVLSYNVAQRTREIGLRVALGATRGQVQAMIFRHGLLWTAAGAAIGLTGCVLAGRAIRSMLYGVPPDDPVTLATAAAVLAVAAAIACYVPARRATRVDPMTALRQE